MQQHTCTKSLSQVLETTLNSKMEDICKMPRTGLKIDHGNLNLEEKKRTKPHIKERIIDYDCEIHGKVKVIQHWVAHDWIGGICSQCLDDRASEEKEKEIKDAQKQKAQKRQEILNKWQQQKPPKFKNSSFENYEAINSAQKQVLEKCRNYVKYFNSALQNKGSMLLHGKCGTGKTHLAIAIADEILKFHHEIKILRYRFWDVLEKLKNSFKKKNPQDFQLSQLLLADLLILDEIGVQYNSDFERNILFQIIDSAYENKKSLIYTTNLTNEDLEKMIGKRNFDRIYETCEFIKFDWDSFRRNLSRNSS